VNTHFRENCEIPARFRRLAIGIGSLLTLVASQSAGAQESINAAADTSLMSAILRAAISNGGRTDLRVDPRPLVANGELYTFESNALAPVSAPDVRLRSAVIQAAGLRTVDATSANQSKNCPGVFVIGKPDSLGDSNSHAGCPKEVFAVLAVGLPRAGSKVLAADEVYDLATETVARGYWAARVIRTSLGPSGSSVYASDYVLAKRAGAWVVIKIVGLMYTE